MWRSEDAAVLLEWWAEGNDSTFSLQRSEPEPSENLISAVFEEIQSPQFEKPTLNVVRLEIKDSAKYLGIILDNKWNWSTNEEDRVKKATATLFSCKKAIGSRWGLSPKNTHWLYMTVIRPILLNGIIVWWATLDKTTIRNRLQRVQRMKLICISGALRTRPSDALNTLSILPLLDVVGRQNAGN